jgi:hypothetical protein
LGFSALKMGMIKLPKTAVFVDFRRFFGVLGAQKPLSSHFFWEFWGFKKAFPQFFLVAWPVEWFGLVVGLAAAGFRAFCVSWFTFGFADYARVKGIGESP